METFEPGDLVRLKSGGPLMTVEHVGKLNMTDDDAVWCVWSEEVGKRKIIQRETFAPVVLERAKKPSAGIMVV